ncbi:MAG: DUF4115 domain-containing protein [Hydrotalea sp.]|nr:DUF4115 domain-containing protein [Hydrotalea sp.]
MKKKKFVDTLGRADNDDGQHPADKKIRWYERLSDRNVAAVGKKIASKITTTAKTTLISPSGKTPTGVLSKTLAAEGTTVSSILTPNQKKYAALSPAQFGLILKKRRKELGLEHTDITRELKFRESFVDALEDGRYYLLPNHYFIRGFINQYADLLDVHEDIYLSYLAEHFQDEVAIKRLLQLNDITTPPTFNLRKGSGYVKKKANYNPTHLTDLLKPISVLVVAGLLFGGYYLFLAIGQKNHAGDATNGATTPHLALRANNDVWVRVTDDQGKILLEAQIAKGKTITLPNQNNLSLTTPAANNILFMLNDQAYRYADNNNNLQNVSLNIDKLMPKLTIAPVSTSDTPTDGNAPAAGTPTNGDNAPAVPATVPTTPANP